MKVAKLVDEYQETQELNQKTLKELEKQIQKLQRESQNKKVEQKSNGKHTPIPQQCTSPLISIQQKTIPQAAQQDGQIQLPTVSQISSAIQKVQASRQGARGSEKEQGKSLGSFTQRYSQPRADYCEYQELSLKKGSDQLNRSQDPIMKINGNKSQGQSSIITPRQEQKYIGKSVNKLNQSGISYNSQTIYQDIVDPYSVKFSQRSQNTFNTIRDKQSNGQEWLEILQYQKEQYEEEMKKRREEKILKAQQYRNQLDNIIQKKHEQDVNQAQQENKQIQKILDTAKQSIQEDNFRMTRYRQRLQDLSHQQAQQAQSQRYQHLRSIEKERQEYQEILKNNQIQESKDQQRKIQLRLARRSDILDQLKQNSYHKLQLKHQNDIEKQEDLKMVEDLDRDLDKREKIYRQQTQRRVSNVNHLMDTLGTQIKDQSVRKEQSYEDWLEQSIDKFEQKIKRVEQERQQSRAMQREKVLNALNQQLLEKEQKDREASLERMKQKDQMNITISQFRQQEDLKRKQKRDQEQQIKFELLRQMEEKQISPERMTSNGSFFNKRALDTAMNDQDLLFNRKLLEEIREKRRKQGRTHIGASD